MRTFNTLLLLLLLWIPRALCIFFAGYVGLAGGMIPPLVVIVILILSWKWPLIGGIVFLALGAAYMIGIDHLTPFIYISLFLLGILFFVNWVFRKQVKDAQEDYWE